jgi:OOP family OmpA-OmpF porin
MRKQSTISPWTRTAIALSLAMMAGAAGAAPGYVTSQGDRIPVTDGFGNCWRVGDWSPAMAASPCHAVPTAQAAPVPVVKSEPPAPAPAPAALAPVQAPPPVIQRITLNTDVLFQFGKAELRPGAGEKLDELAQTMQGAEVDRIVAVGHADRIASEDYNKELSERRAEAVKQYLVQKGVDPQRVQAEGRGEAEPVTQCGKMGPERSSNQKLIACLQPDRRVEIEVLGHRQVAGDTPASGGGASGSPGTSSGSTSGSASGTR